MALIACFIRVERPERLRGLSEALALAEAAANGSTSDVAAGDLELEERLETALETALRDRQVVLETAPDGTDEDSHLRTLQVLSRTLHTDVVHVWHACAHHGASPFPHRCSPARCTRTRSHVCSLKRGRNGSVRRVGGRHFSTPGLTSGQVSARWSPWIATDCHHPSLPLTPLV